MKSLYVTYRNGFEEQFDNVTDLNRFNGMLSFTYKVENRVFKRIVNCRICMDEVRKFEVWEDNVD